MSGKVLRIDQLIVGDNGSSSGQEQPIHHIKWHGLNWAKNNKENVFLYSSSLHGAHAYMYQQSGAHTLHVLQDRQDLTELLALCDTWIARHVLICRARSKVSIDASNCYQTPDTKSILHAL